MRVLIIHAKRFECALKRGALLAVIETNGRGAAISLENTLVVFITAEENDTNVKLLSLKASKEVMEIFKRVRAKSIVVYPYRYLSNTPAPVTKTIEVLEIMEKCMKKKGITTHKISQSGEFLIRPYTHPLAEVSIKVDLRPPANTSSNSSLDNSIHLWNTAFKSNKDVMKSFRCRSCP